MHPDIRAVMANADHPDNTDLEVTLPPGSLLLRLGQNWARQPWPFDRSMIDRPEWRLFLDALAQLDGKPPVRDAAKTRRWLTWLRDNDVVLDHDPQTGFRYVARRPGIDDGIVRRRDPESGPCVRVIGLLSGTGGCLTHGLAYGDPPGQLEGCELVPALVCDLCWRVAHVQLPMNQFRVKTFSSACLRCRTAWALLPDWATRPTRRSMRRPEGTTTVSRETLLFLMGAGFGGERTAVPWAPAPSHTFRDHEVVLIDETEGFEPEESVVWSAWTEQHPPSIETSAHAVVALAQRLVPDGMPLDVDAPTLVGQLRWELGDEDVT